MAKSKTAQSENAKSLYNFPAHDMTIEAESLEDAQAELEKRLKLNRKSND